MNKAFFAVSLILLASGCTELFEDEVSYLTFNAGDFKVNYPDAWSYVSSANEFVFSLGSGFYPILIIERFDDSIFNSSLEVLQVLLGNVSSYESTSLGGEAAVAARKTVNNVTTEAVVAYHDEKFFSLVMQYLDDGEYFSVFKSSFAYQAYELDELGRMVCSVSQSCPQGFNCYSFDDGSVVCKDLDPCEYCSSKECVQLESYPVQIRCI